MESNDLQAVVFRQPAARQEGIGLRRWATALFAYPAFELSFAIYVASQSGMSAPDSVLYAVAVLGLLASIAFIWSRNTVLTFLAILPTGFYLVVTGLKLAQLPAISVMAACVCAFVLGMRLSKART